MNSSKLPDYGSPEYNKFHRQYDGKSSTLVFPHDLDSLEEVNDSLVRISIRMRFLQNALNEFAKIDFSLLIPMEKDLINKDHEKVINWMSDALTQAAEVIEFNEQHFTGNTFEVPLAMDPILSEFITFP